MQADFFKENRKKFAYEIHGGVAVLTAYTAMQRGNDAAYEFEQESNFWWLTGINEADWLLILEGASGKSWLVAPNVSESHQIFDGSLSPQEAQDASGVEAVISYDEGQELLRQLAKKHSIAYTLGDHPHAEYFDFHLNPAPKKLHTALKRAFNAVQDCRKELSRLRAIKQPAEIEAIRGAITLTSAAFSDIYNTLSAFASEYEIEAEFTYRFIKNSAQHAYDPIVAAGKNACTLHYSQNKAAIKKRQLLLMDVGARKDGYAADITRTYAVGEPTKRQRQVHVAVKTAHEQIIALLEPNLGVEQYQREVDRIMTEALLSLGLMENATDEASYRKYFPHAISHGLGADVHDSLGAPKFLQAGMVLTVEPGIYIPEEAIGVRIEDDILITANGRDNLSKGLSTDL